MSTTAENISVLFQSPQTLLLDTFVPGFSLVVSAIYKYLKIDISVYIPFLLVSALLVIAAQYAGEYLHTHVEEYCMSTAEIRVDDELYNMFMGWIASQKFAKKSRKFVANTNLNSRAWNLWRSWDSEDEDAEGDENNLEYIAEEGLEASVLLANPTAMGKHKPLQYTPSFGTHYFWHKGRLFLFRRTENRSDRGFVPASEREEISVATFGRNLQALKALLELCREHYIKRDENKTLIYRGTTSVGNTDPVWNRCMSRVSRPFSTVVLDEEVKQNLLADLRDYLHPYTRRWYSNRGIPYRRGYMLHGPPGTGKSSLAFAIAGFFKLRIYIVSLNSPSLNEENLGALFADLPQRCVVLLEDIDTAGLTNTREDPAKVAEAAKALEEAKGSAETPAVPGAAPVPITPLPGRISLSALLNVLDGVASQEGRVLLMTTNYIDNLDKALIRPGRVDMMVKFDLADTSVTSTLFRGIFASLEGDFPPAMSTVSGDGTPICPPSAKSKSKAPLKAGVNKANSELEVCDRAEREAGVKAKKDEVERVARLADEFAALIPEKAFSPAEIQGYLLKHKRSAEAAIENAEAWVKKTLEEKKTETERKIREEEEKREKAEEEAKKAAEEEAKKKEAEATKKEQDEAAKKLAEDKETPVVNGVKSEGKGAAKAWTNGIKVASNGEAEERVGG